MTTEKKPTVASMQLFVVLALVLMTGCLPVQGEHGKNADGSETYGRFRKMQFEGHDYLFYIEGGGSGQRGGLSHDPECRKCK